MAAAAVARAAAIDSENDDSLGFERAAIRIGAGGVRVPPSRADVPPGSSPAAAGWSVAPERAAGSAHAARSLRARLRAGGGTTAYDRASRPEPRRLHRDGERRFVLRDGPRQRRASASAARALRRGDRRREHDRARRPVAHGAPCRRRQPAARDHRSAPQARRATRACSRTTPTRCSSTETTRRATHRMARRMSSRCRCAKAGSISRPCSRSSARAAVARCSSKAAARRCRASSRPDLLDRLQIAIAPLVTGSGRPGLYAARARPDRRVPAARASRVHDGRRRAVRLRLARDRCRARVGVGRAEPSRLASRR